MDKVGSIGREQGPQTSGHGWSIQCLNGEVTAAVMKAAIQVFKKQSATGRYTIGSSGENIYWCDLMVCVLTLFFFKQARKEMVWKLQ